MAYAGDFTSFSARFQARSETPLPLEAFLEYAIGLTSLIVDLHQVEPVHGALCPKCFQTTAAGEVIWNREFKTLDAARGDRVTAARTERGGVVLSVEDNGIGIAPEQMKRLFQQGFTTWGDGTGIGLHASAIEARHIGATLHAASDGPGRVARFTIELPPTPPPLSRRDKRSEIGRMVQGGSS